MLKKGKILFFVSSKKEETIITASNNRVTGSVVTDKETYSTDFIYRWIDFGFIVLKNKE